MYITVDKPAIYRNSEHNGQSECDRQRDHVGEYQDLQQGQQFVSI